MANIIDIGIYTHRFSEWQVKAIESVARHTKRSFNLILVQEPGTCHQNMNRVLRRSTSRYLVMMDEDVQVLDDWWLDSLEDACSLPDVAIVGCPDVKDESALSHAINTRNVRKVSGTVEERRWIPAHVMFIDKERVPCLMFDEAIPWIMGMTDVDACLQATNRGLKVMRDNRTVVYHPARNDAKIREGEGRPTCEEQVKWYYAQTDYMRSKWGSYFDQLFTQKP